METVPNHSNVLADHGIIPLAFRRRQRATRTCEQMFHCSEGTLKNVAGTQYTVSRKGWRSNKVK